MKIWPLLFLALTGCATGDFCALYQPVKIAPELSARLVAEDRPAAERIALNNRTYERCE